MFAQVDLGLYALSIFVTMLSFFTAFVLTNGIRYTRKPVAVSRVILGGLCIGVGIWATFLISAIAINRPVLIDMKNLVSLVALVFAVLSFLVSLYLCFFIDNRRAGFWISSFVMSFGLNAVYFFALNADCLLCQTTVDLLAFTGLVATGFLFSLAALWFASRQHGTFETFGGSVVIGSCAAIVNYIGLKIPGAPLPEISAYAPAITQFYLALSLAISAYVICALSIVVHWNQEFPRLPPPASRDLLQHESR